MNNQDLLLKTIFACMACDGDIAPEEIQVLRELYSTPQSQTSDPMLLRQ